MDKKYQGTVDLEGIVRSQIKSYDELEEMLANSSMKTMEMMTTMLQRKEEEKGLHRDHYMEDEKPKKRENTNLIFKG